MGYYMTLLVVCEVIIGCWSQDTDIVNIPVCEDYQNLKTNTSANPREIVIPAIATSGIAYTDHSELHDLHFQISNKTKFKCSKEQASLISVSFNPDTHSTDKLAARNFNSGELGSSDAHPVPYFTATGYFYDNVSRVFYKPDNGDFCVTS